MARQTMTCKRGILRGRMLAMVMAVGLAFGATGGEVTATAVMAQQHYPWDGMVDIAVTFAGASNDVAQTVCAFVATNNTTGEALSVAHITAFGDAVGSDMTWHRRFVWNAIADVGEVNVDDVALTVQVEAQLGGVQLWENGPYWAECNVGATKPEEYGYYFWWGDTVGYTRNGGTWYDEWNYYADVSWVSSHGNHMSSSPFSSCPTRDKGSAQLQSDGYIDAAGNLVAEYDAATTHLGVPWQMPTVAEFLSLSNNCVTAWTTCNGVYGMRVTGCGAYSSKSIFFPAAGYGGGSTLSSPGSLGRYWSSTPSDNNAAYACGLSFRSGAFGQYSDGRWNGRPIRPIRWFVPSSMVTTHMALDCRVPPATPVISPEDGTIFAETCTVNISCESEGATIHYTTDGSEPTLESPVYAQFTVSGRTTVKARAFYSNGNGSETSVAEYAIGQCPEPEIVSAGGATFNRRGNVVSIDWTCSDGVVRYTTDGIDVTADSPVYADPFTIDVTTVVKAKAFGVEYFDSAQVAVEYVRVMENVATPVISTADAFENASQEVSISCATDGATILYTTDGSDPTYGGIEYVGPFTIYRTTTVKAISIMDDMLDSTVASKTLTRQDALGQAANLFMYAFETDSDHPWTIDKTVSKDGISSVKSGAIGANGSTYIQTSVKGAGELSFWWRAKCEEPDPRDGPDGYYDYGVLKVGGVASAYLAGNDTGWQKFTTNITTTGKHVLRWEYNKDDSTSYSPDCVWLDCVQWIPTDSDGYTVTTPERVPYVWLDAFGLGEESDYESAALATNGKKTLVGDWHVWQDYVAGTDPTNSLSRFYADIAVVDEVPIVSWYPDLNSNGVTRVYKVWGKKSLDEIRWTYPTNSTHRFFKVTVELP